MNLLAKLFNGFLIMSENNYNAVMSIYNNWEQDCSFPEIKEKLLALENRIISSFPKYERFYKSELL